MSYFIGIDIGSTSTKTAVLDENSNPVFLFVQPTGWSSVETAESVRKRLLEEGYDTAICPVVATGYGRVAVPFADKTVTEITCHAKGAIHIHGSENLTIVDIGGQDTKVIRAMNGKVADFAMNDKCSAGTGRFLEVMANTMGVGIDKMCEMAAEGSGVSISSMCTVFAESEVISLIGRGEKRENIAFAVVDSIIKKVGSQVAHVDLSDAVCLTGGLCDVEYIREALSKALKREILTDPKGRYAGAIGAALAALKVRKEATAQ